MDSEVRRCHDRIGLYVLMQKHPNWTLKSYGLALNRSEGWVRKWRHRIISAEQLTMDTFLSQSRAPKTRPRQTPRVVKKAIGDLREELSEAYHRKAGSRLIQLKLNEMDDLFEAGYFVPSHHTTVNRILRELGYITLARIQCADVTQCDVLTGMSHVLLDRRQNRWAKTLREIGRLERTFFALQWIQDKVMRQQVHQALYKGEARNALSRTVCIHRLGRIHDRSRQDQHYRASALNLVVSAITVWNTIYIEKAVEHFRHQGWEITDKHLEHLTPLGWEHISLTGDYIWNPNLSTNLTNLRDLRV